MDWKERALSLLKDSLEPIPSELNEIDWKSGLSDKTERLAQHISAFANNYCGGMLVYGVNDDGTLFSLTKEKIDEIIKKLGNIAYHNLSNHIQLEHAVQEYNGESLLFIFIHEEKEKPVHLRGKDIYASYYRSGGQTLKMSSKQVQMLIAKSVGISFEENIAMDNVSPNDVLKLLDYQSMYRILDKNIPKSTDSILTKMTEMGYCYNKNGAWAITNLGAILFARSLSRFPTLSGREIVVRKYAGKNNLQLEHEQRGVFGYAVGFEGLIDYIMRNTGNEVINVARNVSPIYPQVAIREFVANALIHQDFAIDGSPITIEIFSNRLVITNPGAPLNNITRLLDLPPRSRNERLAQSMLLLNLCERRGSGVDRAIEAVEKMFLPPVKFQALDDYTRVSLFPQKHLSEMTKQEKILACYQHACLMWENNEAISNQSIRERFKLNKNQAPTATRILADTVEAGFIKSTEDEFQSRKYSSYIPFYA
ncbi:MAG: putative DNA binding domain-containing protein [Muribaculaceae bacterium]|nr:putative DNA binding domain-containing protein [Muribaculaceae bacterium]